MREFDAIVIGAGPAGLRAADRLAKAKLRVLCLEKKQEIGVPKRCAEGLGIGWFHTLGLKPDKKWAVQEINGAVLYAPSGKSLQLRFPKTSGYILERRVFEKQLAKQAVLSGALVKTKADAFEFKRKGGKVNVKVEEAGDIREYAAPLIIACDGVETMTGRRLGVNTAMGLSDYDSGYQYEMVGIDIPDEKLIHLYFGTAIAKRGYVWIFPKGKHHANVGIGIAGTSEQTAKSCLDKFIAARPGLSKGSVIEVNCGCIPVGGFLPDMTADNLLIVGDAAHQVNPIHGGGIGIAMEAADLAADVAIKAFKARDFSHRFLQQYNALWYRLRGNKLKGILKKRLMFEQLQDKDFETLAESISGEDILKITEGDLVAAAKVVTKKLVRHPGLVKVMLKYLR